MRPVETPAPQLPDTPVGRQCAAWLDVFNDSARDDYGAFLKRSYPSRAAALDEEWSFRQMTGGFTLRKVEESAATRLVALVQERDSDVFAQLTMEVDRAAPHVIAWLDVQAIDRPAEFALPHLSEDALLVALRTKLDDYARRDRFAGAILFARHATVLHAAAYGFADRDRRIANTLLTRFRIGSMNKMFTATAILQLVQAGAVALDDPVGKYLADYPNQDVARKVTIRHLLTHTGGTGDIFGSEFAARRLELRTLRDYVALYGKRGPDFEPGSRWAYSNYGYILLGLVVEKASGQDYYDYVRARIYEPTGMKSSGSEPEEQAASAVSVGYTIMEGSDAWRPNTETLPYRGTSAGGGYSTVEDLLRFATALARHVLLDGRHTALLTEGQIDKPGGGRYGFGFREELANGTHCFGHSGGAPGMSGDLKICPEQGYVIAVLANIDPMAAVRVSEFIANRLPHPTQ